MDRSRPFKLAILNTHPIQYFAPLYRRVAEEESINLTVYYCSKQGLQEYVDTGFGEKVKWDVPLLDGYNYKFLNNLRNDSSVNGFFSLINLEIIAELKKHNYDAIWIHGYNYFTHLLTPLIAKLVGTKVFIRGETHLLLDRTNAKRLTKKMLMGLFYRSYDACLAIGSRNEEFYKYHNVSEKKIFLVPYTVDNTFFKEKKSNCQQYRKEYRKKINASEDTPVIIFASKFMARKRPKDLLVAVKRLSEENKRVILVMVGSGELENELKEYVRKHKLDNIYFTGFINQSELPKWYLAADIFVLPSENEPWGLIINEVMASGLPVIASKEIGAVADLVKDGENGYTYPAGDVDSLKNALKKIISNPEDLKKFGRKSSEIIRSWSYEECVSGLKKALYQTA